MSTVNVRRVEFRLERLIAQGAGPTTGQALAAASRNLRELREPCLRALDERITRLTAFLARDPAERPSDQALDALAQDADAALTACSALDAPLMARALLMFAAQVDALKQTHRWPSGALNPAINFIVMVRSGKTADEVASKIMTELGACLDQYSSLSCDVLTGFDAGEALK